jgi:dihydrodipicolinate synthase/N-acetylneuraminate lyase
MTNERTELLRGAVVAVVTPTTPDYKVDYDRFREQIRFIIEGGSREGTGVLLLAGGGDVWGMQAFMSWLGNWDPESCANVAKLFLQGEYLQYAEAYLKAGRFHGDVVKALGFGKKHMLGEGTLGKAKMELVGRPCGPPFPPQAEPTEAELEQLKKVAQKHGFIADNR